ncbi:uncharacterized protein LOC126184267 [Schistocerca cancellata]|uniref:uncharacterized protein LOC126184267 n=1 Tax=Schistocerca cancellata TaxID=274614 RepID=UPI002118747D|nr:uncharacterized protein LOC126184267 [Schistocerca cancellata]
MSFDTEKFIQEIERRRAIWDVSCEEYSDRDVKEKKMGGNRKYNVKKQKSNDDGLIDVLQQSIALREERERNQESDSDRLFLISLLEDMKKIPEQRKLLLTS